MNTHDIKLPQGYAERPFDYWGELYTEGQVRAAIEADRKRWGVNSTHTLGEPECNHCGGTGDVSGEYPGVACPACAGTGKAPPSSEPMVINAIFETCEGEVIGTTEAKVKRYELQDDGSITVVIDYWPQPSESYVAPMSDKPVCGAQNRIQATQQEREEN